MICELFFCNRTGYQATKRTNANCRNGSFFFLSDSKGIFTDCSIHHNGDAGVWAYEEGTLVELRGEQTEIHHNGEVGLFAMSDATLNIYIPSQYITAILVSLYFGSMSIGRLLTAIATSKPTWSKILTPTKLITFDLMLALASYILLVSVGSYSLIPMIVSVSGIGLAFSSMYPMGLALAETKFQPTGLQQSMFVGGAPLGGIILPTIIGTVSCSINLCFSF